MVTEPQPPTPKPDTVLAQQPLTEAEALRIVGWIQPIDYVMLVVVTICWVTLFYWKLFSDPSPLQILSCCLVAFAAVQAWVVILVFRCSHFVLLLTATVNNMPDVAARIAVAYLSGSAAKNQQQPKRHG